MQLKRAVLAGLLLATVAGSSAHVVVLAQPAPAGGPKPARRKGPPVRTMHQALNQMPASMPVPSPPDAKFVMGFQNQYSGEKAMTYVRLTSNNAPKELADWYKKNLQSYGWTVKERPGAKSSDPSTLNGIKAKSSCVIGFAAPTSAAVKATTVMITFNEAR